MKRASLALIPILLLGAALVSSAGSTGPSVTGNPLDTEPTLETSGLFGDGLTQRSIVCERQCRLNLIDCREVSPPSFCLAEYEACLDGCY